ncbi:MAG: MobC family plasmid mobilization relaxosome protein [Betaproteobacteria bacterium]|nr:MobC family plasmid mobilization relaxosome protein [Betaproteobacteria bacterium]
MDTSIFKLRGVGTDQKKRLAALAKERYGRASASLYVRHLIDDALASNPVPQAKPTPAASKHVVKLPKPQFTEQKNRRSPVSRMEIRLQQGERLALNAVADQAKSSPQFYLAALLRAHLLRHPQFLGADLDALRESSYQLAKIGTNLNQVARALNAGERRRGVELKAIEALAVEVKKHVEKMGKVVSANLARWDIL